MKQEKLWVFAHLPKTGGTTLEGHLYKHLMWDETFIELSNWGRVYRQENKRLPFHKRPIEERDRAQVICGHHVYYGIHKLVPKKQPRYFTVVRDPADRCISMYNFRRSRGQITQNFHKWYTSTYNTQHKNFMVNFYADRMMSTPVQHKDLFSCQLAKKFIDHCWYVADTKYIE